MGLKLLLAYLLVLVLSQVSNPANLQLDSCLPLYYNTLFPLRIPVPLKHQNVKSDFRRLDIFAVHAIPLFLAPPLYTPIAMTSHTSIKNMPYKKVLAYKEDDVVKNSS